MKNLKVILARVNFFPKCRSSGAVDKCLYLNKINVWIWRYFELDIFCELKIPM